MCLTVSRNWWTAPVPIKPSRRVKKSKEKLINEDSERKPTPISIFSRRGSHFSAQFYRRDSKKMKKCFPFASCPLPSVSCCDFLRSWKLVSISSSSRLANKFLRVKFFVCEWRNHFPCAAFFSIALARSSSFWDEVNFHILSWVTRSQSQMFWGRKLITGRWAKKNWILWMKTDRFLPLLSLQSIWRRRRWTPTQARCRQPMSQRPMTNTCSRSRSSWRLRWRWKMEPKIWFNQSRRTIRVETRSCWPRLTQCLTTRRQRLSFWSWRSWRSNRIISWIEWVFIWLWDEWKVFSWMKMWSSSTGIGRERRIEIKWTAGDDARGAHRGVASSVTHRGGGGWWSQECDQDTAKQ